MGAFFTRASGHTGGPVIGAYPAGVYSADASIAPFLGRNTGSYDGLNKTTLPPIPFEWMVSPTALASPDQCPSGAATLLTFGITDLATAALTVVFACQPVVRVLSFGRMGNREKHATRWTWTVHLAFLLLGNAVVAAMIGRTPGYEQLNMLHIFTLYTSRPRINTVLLAILRSLVGVRQSRSAREKRPPRNARRRQTHDYNFPYADAYVAAAAAELVLQLIAAIFTGVTWDRMPPVSEGRSYSRNVVQFVEGNPGLLVLAVLVFVPIYQRYGEAFFVRGRYLASRFRSSDTPNPPAPSAKRLWVHRFFSALIGILFVGFTFLTQYNYWVQFLELPGALWCPPKLLEQGIIWTLFTTLGNIAGASA